MQEVAEFVVLNQFPRVVIPNRESIDLIFHHKIPALIFFNGEKENPMIEVLKMVSRYYTEYLVLMIIDYNDENLDIDHALYLKDFMDINHAP